MISTVFYWNCICSLAYNDAFIYGTCTELLRTHSFDLIKLIIYNRNVHIFITPPRMCNSIRDCFKLLEIAVVENCVVLSIVWRRRLL